MSMAHRARISWRMLVFDQHLYTGYMAVLLHSWLPLAQRPQYLTIIRSNSHNVGVTGEVSQVLGGITCMYASVDMHKALHCST